MREECTSEEVLIDLGDVDGYLIPSMVLSFPNGSLELATVGEARMLAERILSVCQRREEGNGSLIQDPEPVR